MLNFGKYLKGIEFTLNKLLKNKHFKYGAPFFSFVLIGSFILQQCQTVRYEFRKAQQITKEELEALGYTVPEKQTTLEEHYEKVKHLAHQDWENKRIPRPWEETPQNN